MKVRRSAAWIKILTDIGIHTPGNNALPLAVADAVGYSFEAIGNKARL